MDLFNTFLENKETIEDSVGEKLEWMDLPDATASRILLMLPCNPKDKSRWEEYFEWCVRNGSKFRDEFIKYAK